MADLKYVVTLSHRGKGIGFSAREALRNAAKQDKSSITRAVFCGEQTGTSTKLEVTIGDDLLRRTITGAIDVSGRMPTIKGLYTIESVLLQEGANTPVEGNSIRDQYAASQQQVAELREENERLRQALAKPRDEVHTPLEGLLAYFESTTYSPEVLFDDSTDLDFARRVLGKEIGNQFSDYVNDTLCESLVEDEVDRILAYTPESSDERTKSDAKYDIARKELDFLQKLKSGKVDMPDTVRESTIALIEAKRHPDTIQAYKSRIQEQEELESKQETLRELKVKYDSFSEKIDLLTQAGEDVPVIFNFDDGGIDLYFPFQSVVTNPGFVDDLGKELGTYFGKSEIQSLEHKFVGYRVLGSDLTGGVDRLVEEAPVTLTVAGFNRIIPYGLG